MRRGRAEAPPGALGEDRTWESRPGVRLRRGLRRLAERFGYHVASKKRHDVLPSNFYSPIPKLSELPPDAFDRRSAVLGIELDTGAQVAWAEQELADHVREFDPPGPFDEENLYYGPADAELAYAFVRQTRPRRLIELGSGWSTLVLAEACRRNAAEGSPVSYRVFDPYPPDAGADPPEVAERLATRAQLVPIGEFDALEAGDILFVDTSHTVKLGGDVNFIVLDVLPRLAPGVLVHFHDIWLPYEYHRALLEELNMYWAEQYLLQAFLAFNPRFEVVFATQAACREHPERMMALVPSYRGENWPTSFWIRSR